MNMNKHFTIYNICTLLLIPATSILSGCDNADSKIGSSDSDYNQPAYADVLKVKPLTRTVDVPREVCSDMLVTRTRESKDPNQITGTVVGAVIGGVLGNQIGKGKGNDVATVAGVVGGGVAGNQVQQKMQENNTYQETERQCVTVNDSHQEPAGFEVTYRYNGEDLTVLLNHDPGQRLSVKNGELAL